MEKTCGCKGIRSCILCEKQEKPTKQQNCQKSDCVDIYDFCCHCGKAWLQSSQKSDIDEGKLSNCEIIATPQCCESHDEQGTRKFIHFPGIHIYCDFISETEERRVCDKIYETPFCLSQSGRRKQDYGPKVNFKKKKLKLAEFTGLPEFSKDIYDRMKRVDVLSDFKPVELCNLEYSAERGASIDPHFDDFWLWGERLVTLNLLSDSVLCFTNDDVPGTEVHVPMFQRSLLVVYGPARNKWKHAIHRCDIKDKRIAVTLRELSDEFQKGGSREEEGTNLLEIALTFKGTAIGVHKASEHSEP